MSERDFHLSDAFPPVLMERWREVVERDLKGAPFEKKLVRRTGEGVTYQPLYTGEDDAPAAGVPGAAPFTRGAVLPTDDGRGWEIRQDVMHPDPSVVRIAAREELAHGTDGLILRLDPSGEKGVIAPNADALAECLADVDLAKVPVGIESGPHYLAVSEALNEVWSRRGLTQTDARGSFLADPLTPLQTKGRLPVSLDVLLGELGELGVRCRDAGTGVTAAKISTCPVHNAGGGAAQELGTALAAGLTYLKALTGAGLTLAEAARQVQVCYSTGGTFFLDLAKLRAARTLWARLIEASGGAPEDGAIRVHARTSVRMLSRRDPWVNMLRATAGAFAAATGGAEMITVTPFDHLLGPAGSFSRRIARNVQVILQEESHLGWVADPAGGSWFLESLTEQLCDEGWAFFQAIEAEGGVAAAVTGGWLRDRTAESWAGRLKDLSSRRAAVTGVSEFPNIEETLPEIEAPDRAAVGARWGAPGILGRDGEPVTAPALPAHRNPEPYEALRDAADAHLAATGSRPRVFQACLGPIAQHTARATWSRNVCEAGGLEVLASDPCDGAADAAAAFRESGAAIALICSSDRFYEEMGEATARALKDAGAGVVILAGRFGDKAADWNAAGADLDVFLGRDILDFLRTLHRHAGVEA